MSKSCVICTELNRTNQNRLNPLLLPIIYESADIITSLSLPRKYTSSHNDTTQQIFISIGHNYNQSLLNNDESLNTQSQVIGEWLEINGKLAIQLEVLVSTEKNPNAAIRNTIFCNELGVVLEGIAFAETGLLKLHPHLASTKIFIKFHSIDPNYDRTEYWHRLGYWTQNCMKDPSHLQTVISSSRKHNSHTDNNLPYHEDTNSTDNEKKEKKKLHYEDTNSTDNEKKEKKKSHHKDTNLLYYEDTNSTENKKKEKKEKKKSHHHHERRSPQLCAACKK
jgi:hypothetical protein